MIMIGLLKVTMKYLLDFFEKNIKYFKFNGGDMETLFHKCKIAHSKRMLYCDVELRKIINNQDLLEGMKLFLENDDIKKEMKQMIGV